jgi:hypothetical protein
MMKAKQKTYGWIDMVLFLGFLVAFFLSLTGVELHQWIGIFCWLLAIYHLLAHWDWVRAVSKKIFGSASGILQLRVFVDGLVLAGFVMIVGTGLVISSWLNLPLSNYAGWLIIHILASITTLLVLMVKLAMHWRWISKTTKDIFSQHVLSPATPMNLQPVPVERGSMERRDFLRVMGFVTGGSLIALMSATKSLAALQADEAVTGSQSDMSETDPSFFTNSGDPQSYGMDSGTNSSCSIQCEKRCSYPGHCHRYTDSNNNNRCDFGECA